MDDTKFLALRRWVTSRRGVLKRIADRQHVTVQMVSQVLYGRSKSKDGRIESELKKLGAPINVK